MEMTDLPEFTPDVRLGWLVSTRPDDDGAWWAVRNSDGRTVESHSQDRLLGAMMAADVAWMLFRK